MRVCHLQGVVPVDVDALVEIAGLHGVPLVDDALERLVGRSLDRLVQDVFVSGSDRIDSCKLSFL